MFPPGSPQRIAATCPQLPHVMAKLRSLLDDVRLLDMGHMSHREVLQAGIQQLNAEFYRAMTTAAVRRQ